MAKHLMEQARQAAISAFAHGKTDCKIFGIILHIQHAYGNNFQVLLPDESEIFRIVGNQQRAKIFAV